MALGTMLLRQLSDHSLASLVCTAGVSVRVGLLSAVHSTLCSSVGDAAAAAASQARQGQRSYSTCVAPAGARPQQHQQSQHSGPGPNSLVTLQEWPGHLQQRPASALGRLMGWARPRSSCAAGLPDSTATAACCGSNSSNSSSLCPWRQPDSHHSEGGVPSTWSGRQQQQQQARGPQQQQQQQQQQQPLLLAHKQLHGCWPLQQQQQAHQLLPVCWYSTSGKAWRQQQRQQAPGSSSSSGDQQAVGPRPSAAGAPPQSQPKMRRNKHISAPSLVVVFPDGRNEVLSLAAALQAAEGCGLDLVEVNPRAQPPVARILDYGKLHYEQQQKAEAADKQRRLQQKLSTPKEMQFSARIADHDLEVKMRKVTTWLEEGFRVMLVVKHRNEELEAAADALSYLTTRLQSEFKVEVGPQQPQRRALAALVKPLKQ